MVNPETLTCFTAEQGNLLIRLIIAHLLSDFALQSNAMVQNKKAFSPYMALHIGILGMLTWLLSGEWILALIICGIHWAIDSIKISLLLNRPQYNNKLFIVDQLIHILTILLIWSWHFDSFHQLLECIKLLISYFPYSLPLRNILWSCPHCPQAPEAGAPCKIFLCACIKSVDRLTASVHHSFMRCTSTAHQQERQT